MNSEQPPTSLSRWRQAPEGGSRATLTRSGLTGLPSRTFGRLPIVVSRSLCRLRWFRLATLKPHERLDALRLQALAWQPFEDSAHALALLGDSGLVIAWDRHAAQQALESAGLEPSRVARVAWQPEPLFCQAGEEGVRLVRATEGVEAQVWSQGHLQASQWWPDVPEPMAWSRFLHAAGQPPQELPDAGPVPLLTRAWAPVMDIQASAGQSNRERRVVMVGALALAFCLGLAGRQWFGLHQAEKALEQRFAGLSQKADQQTQARRAALDLAQQLRVYDRWLASPLPMDVVEHLRDTLAGTGAVVKLLELRDQHVRVGLQAGPAVQRAALIRALSAGSWFRDVTEVRAEDAPGLVMLDIRLEGRRAPAAATMVQQAIGADAAPASAAPQGPATQASPFSAAPPAASQQNSPAVAVQGGQPGALARSGAAPAAPAASARLHPVSPTDLPPASVFDAIPTHK